MILCPSVVRGWEVARKAGRKGFYEKMAGRFNIHNNIMSISYLISMANGIAISNPSNPPAAAEIIVHHGKQRQRPRCHAAVAVEECLFLFWSCSRSEIFGSTIAATLYYYFLSPYIVPINHCHDAVILRPRIRGLTDKNQSHWDTRNPSQWYFLSPS